VVTATGIRTCHSLPQRLLRVGTLRGISAEQLQRESVEHSVAADGNLQMAVHTARLRLQVEQPCSTATAHQENVVKSQNQTAALGAPLPPDVDETWP